MASTILKREASEQLQPAEAKRVQQQRAPSCSTIPDYLFQSPLHRPVTIQQLPCCRAGLCPDCHTIADLKLRYELFIQPYHQPLQQQPTTPDEEEEEDEEPTFRQDNAAFETICGLREENEKLQKEVKRLKKSEDKKSIEVSALRESGRASMQSELILEDRSAKVSRRRRDDTALPIDLPKRGTDTYIADDGRIVSVKSETPPLRGFKGIPSHVAAQNSDDDDDKPLVEKNKRRAAAGPSKAPPAAAMWEVWYDYSPDGGDYHEAREGEFATIQEANQAARKRVRRQCYNYRWLELIELRKTPKSEPKSEPDSVIEYTADDGALRFVHDEVGYGDGRVKVVKKGELVW